MKRMEIWEELQQTFSDMEDIFHKALLGANSLLPELPEKELFKKYRNPLTEIDETEEYIVLKAELPGMKKENIKVNKLYDGIEIKAERSEEEKENNRHKKSYKGFYRYISLPKNAQIDTATTTYKDGILKIKMEKREGIDERKPLTIE